MVTQPDFAHDRAGTPAEAWTQDPRWSRTTPLELDGVRRVVVVAAHPDDESLGAGGLLAAAHHRGLTTEVVLLTAGELSHPRSPTHSAEQLAGRRLDEARAAVAAVAPGSTMTLLSLGDGSLARAESAITARIVDVVGNGSGTLIVAPWRHDGHPDHEAAGRAAATAARRTDASLVEYPIWWWHWATPDDAPWSELRRFDLDDAARGHKRDAVAAHVSQVRPLSDEPGDEVLLSPDFLAHFAGPVEHFVAGPREDGALDDLHRGDEDPWGVDDRWYERRKRDLTLGVLPRRRFRHGLEVGCSTGALADALAPRCDELDAVDSSASAVAAAQARLAGRTGVRVRHLEVPREWPTGELDLVVVSEVGYFLSPLELEDLVERVDGTLAPDGVVVLCHWRHPVDGWVLDARQVHDAFVAGVRRPVQATYRDRDVEIIVLGDDDVLPAADA